MPDTIAPSYRELTVDQLPIALEMRYKMVRELSGEDLDVIAPGWRDRYDEFYGGLVAQGRATVFVAEIGDDPVAVAAVYLLDNHRARIYGRPSAYLSNVWVSPQYRRRGIAAALTRRAIDWAKTKGCEVIRLRSSDMGRSVYASVGFTPTDEMEIYLR